MKLSIIKKMALLLVGLATVQGYAAADFYKVNQGGSSTQYRIESDNKCNTDGCIFVGDNNLFDIGEFSFNANTNELVIQDLNTSLADGPERVYTISAYGKDGKTSYWSSSKIDNQGYVTGDSHYDYGYFNKDSGTPCASTFLQSETFTVNKSGRHVFDLTSFINELKEYNFGQVRLVLENLQFYDVNYSALKKYEKILKYESFYHRNGVTYGAFVDVEFPPFYFHVIQNRSFEVPENGSEKVSLTLWSSKAFSFQLEMKDRDDDDNHWAVVRSGNYSLSEVNRVITLSEAVSWKKEPGVKNYRWKINCDGVVYYSDVYSVYNELPMFRLIFLGFEGEELWSSSIIYGNNPARFAPSLTVKEDSEEFHYFVKWTPEIVPLTEAATYKAVLDSAKKDFNVYLAADYEAGGDISLSVENKTSCVSITNTYLDGFSYSSNSAVKLTGGAHTLRFDITLNTNGDCANDELAKTIKWTCADESELHFDGCTAIPVYVNGVKNERMLLSEHNDGVYNNGFEYNFTIDAGETATIQLAATYAVGGDVELVSTNAASCVSITKRLLNANCDSYDENGLCLTSEMFYRYGNGTWQLDQGPQDWPIGAGDVNLKPGKSYQLEYSLSFKPNNCTEKEFVEAYALTSDKQNLPIYINGSKVGTVGTFLTHSPYFNFTLKSQYTITFFDDKGVQVGDVVTVASGMAVSAPAEPAKREGYTFAGWFQKDAETAYDFSAAVNEDLELYGKWTINKYEIAVAANDSKMGSVKGAGTYEYGTEVELVATAAKGYKFSNWEDDVKASATRKVKVTAAASYKAVFEEIATNSSSSSVIPGGSDESSSSSAKASSSSSAKASSSSSAKAGSSSSKKTDANSSSSAKNGSSSSVIPSGNEKSSSSSAKANSSSSSKMRNSSSSAKKDAVVATAAVPQFSVAVVGRNVQIAGATVGAKVSVFDMQGSLISTGRAASANFAVEMPRSGSYLVRVGSRTQRVNVK